MTFPVQGSLVNFLESTDLNNKKCAECSFKRQSKIILIIEFLKFKIFIQFKTFLIMNKIMQVRKFNLVNYARSNFFEVEIQNKLTVYPHRDFK